MLVAEILQRSLVERQVTATMAAAGAKGSDKRPLKLCDPEEERMLFDRRLIAPLGVEKQRGAWLEELRR